jgi:hypothetical protein
MQAKLSQSRQQLIAERARSMRFAQTPSEFALWQAIRRGKIGIFAAQGIGCCAFRLSLCCVTLPQQLSWYARPWLLSKSVTLSVTLPSIAGIVLWLLYRSLAYLAIGRSL